MIRRYQAADHAAVLGLHREGLAQVGLRPGDGVYYDHDFYRMDDIYLRSGGEFVVGELRPADDPAPAGAPPDRATGRPAGGFAAGSVARVAGGLMSRIVAMGGLRRADVVPCGVARAHGGYAANAPVSDTAEMVRLRVHPSLQRRGFGAAIVLALEERAAELGYRTLHCDTTAMQGPAMALYRRFGWRETKRETIGGIVNVYFEKRLR